MHHRKFCEMAFALFFRQSLEALLGLGAPPLGLLADALTG